MYNEKILQLNEKWSSVAQLARDLDDESRESTTQMMINQAAIITSISVVIISMVALYFSDVMIYHAETALSYTLLIRLFLFYWGIAASARANTWEMAVWVATANANDEDN